MDLLRFNSLHSLDSYICFTCFIHIVPSPFTRHLQNQDMHPMRMLIPSHNKTIQTNYHHSHLSTMRPTSLTQKLLLLFQYVCAHSLIRRGNGTCSTILSIYLTLSSLACSMSLCRYGFSICNEKCHHLKAINFLFLWDLQVVTTFQNYLT